MSIAPGSINLFPSAFEILRGVTLALLVAGFGTVLLLGSRLAVRARRRGALTRHARSRGLGEAAARLAGRVLQDERPRAAVAALRTPALLLERLVQGFLRCARREAADRYADGARALLAELGPPPPPFAGAPEPFEALTLVEAGRDDAAPVRGWVVDVDDHSLSVATFCPCPWTIRAELAVTRASGQHAFAAVLLLRPMPGSEVWVMSHDLAGPFENRRRAARVPVDIATVSLPADERLAALRERLRHGDRLELSRLRRSESWARRHNITVDDLSADGAQVTLDHEVTRGARFHIVVPDDEHPGAVAALPLAEVVSVRSGPGGRLVAGTRFCAMRMKERVAMTDYVRRAAAAAAARPVPSGSESAARGG